MEIPRAEDVLRKRGQIFVVTVVAPVGLSRPVFRELVVQPAIRAEPFRIEWSRHRAGIEKDGAPTRAREVPSEMCGETVEWRPQDVEISVVRLVGVGGKLLAGRLRNEL